MSDTIIIALVWLAICLAYFWGRYVGYRNGWRDGRTK